jgi:hypothetical protein
VVVRVSNVTATSFDVRLRNSSGGAVAAENVSYVVVEEGMWTIDGVNVGAQTYLSTVPTRPGWRAIRGRGVGRRRSVLSCTDLYR